MIKFTNKIRYIKNLLLLSSGILFGLTANAMKYYVASNGSNDSGDGSISKPWQSLSFAATLANKVGDTIVLKPGIFLETNTSIVSPGVNIEGAGVTETFIKYNGVANSDYLVKLESPSLRTEKQFLSNFTFDGNGKKLFAGISVIKRSNVAVHDIAFKNMNYTALRFTHDHTKSHVDHTPPKGWLKGIKIYNNTFLNCAKALTGSKTGNVLLAHLDGGEVFNNTIEDNAGYGIKGVDNGGWFMRTKIYNNKINVLGNISIEPWHTSEENFIYNNTVNCLISLTFDGKKEGAARTVTFYGNKSYLDGDGRSGFGIGYEIHSNTDVEAYGNYILNPGGAGAFMLIDDIKFIRADSNIRIHHNVIVSNKGPFSNSPGAGLDATGVWMAAANDDMKEIHIYNNVFQGLYAGVKFRSYESHRNPGEYPNIMDVKVKNNIFFENKHNVLFGSDQANVYQRVEITNNIYFKSENVLYTFQPTPIVISPSELTVQNNYNKDPQLQFSGEIIEPYYKPVSSSSFAVDKGINVGLEFKGSAPDIGAVEYDGLNNLFPDNNKMKSPFNVYPNPFLDNIIIENKEYRNLIQRVDVFDALGNLINSFNSKNEDRMLIPMNEVSPGLYYLRIYSVQGNYTVKMSNYNR